MNCKICQFIHSTECFLGLNSYKPSKYPKDGCDSFKPYAGNNKTLQAFIFHFVTPLEIQNSLLKQEIKKLKKVKLSVECKCKTFAPDDNGKLFCIDCKQYINAFWGDAANIDKYGYKNV